MAAIYDFAVPFTLTTPRGTLLLNQQVYSGTDPLGFFLVDTTASSSGAEMRVSRDDMPQASGEIAHLHYKTGYEMRLKVELWETTGQPAWRDTLTTMADLLQKHLNAIIDDNPVAPLAIVADPLGLTRIQWTPVGYPTRMIDKIRLLERPVFSNDGELSEVTFGIMAERPYAMDLAEITTSTSGSATLTNLGTANFYPVVKVHGPFTQFTLSNTSTLDQNGQALKVVYDSTLPGAVSVGGGHYIELDFWRNTVYYDGNVSNYRPGLDLLQSDFWFLQPGANTITIGGGYGGTGVDILWQAAWA